MILTSKSRGFTLIELLVVIAIIAIFVSCVCPCPGKSTPDNLCKQSTPDSRVNADLRTGTTITYLKNGVVFYTSLVPCSATLIVDTALYSSPGKITNCQVSYLPDHFTYVAP